MRQTPTGPNFYAPDTVEEMVVMFRENVEKSRTLHEARSKAWQAMRDASVEHEFLVRCADACDRDSHSIHHRLEELVRRDANRAVEEAA